MRNYKDPQYKQWRKEVYERDNHKCQWPNCAYTGKKLNAHHIKKWSEYPGLRFNKQNGITLCYNHHKLIFGMESDYELFFLKLVANKS
jgi:5-methylcytosine-specific restriction endonuclease McrA